MHYQTHHPFFFHFHPITSINPPPPPSSSPPSFPLLSSHSSQVEKQEMECVEGALKGSFRKELALKSNHQQGYNFEEFCTVNGQSGVVSVEDFSVDDLLDFSKMGANEDDEGFLMQDHEHEEEEEDEEKSCLCPSVSPSQQQQQKDQKAPTQNSNLPFKDDFGSSELSVPTDDVADLEWLSHFVEDSFSEYSALTYPAGTAAENTKNSPEKGSELETASPTNPSFVTPVPVKARSKRSRTGGRLWSFGSSSATTESSSSSSSSSSSTSSPSTPWLIYAMPPGHKTDLFNSVGKVAVKKQKKRPVSEAGSVGCGVGGGGGGTQAPRRCSHCGVQKTPQWRTGPLGAKTLCNACGVRFKSGRLLPEYRPACSPTFSSDLHSNHHRKVLEMRKKKDISGLESGLAPAVHSF